MIGRALPIRIYFSKAMADYGTSNLKFKYSKDPNLNKHDISINNIGRGTKVFFTHIWYITSPKDIKTILIERSKSFSTIKG